MVYGSSLEQVFERFWWYMEVLENRFLGDFGAIWRFSKTSFWEILVLYGGSRRTFLGASPAFAHAQPVLPVVCGAARVLSSVFGGIWRFSSTCF